MPIGPKLWIILTLQCTSPTNLGSHPLGAPLKSGALTVQTRFNAVKNLPADFSYQRLGRFIDGLFH